MQTILSPLKLLNNRQFFRNIRKRRISSREFRENLWTLPNIITLSRIAATPCISVLIVQQRYGWALGCLGYCAVSDFV